VFAKDLLFATLDPTMRQIELPAIGKNAGQGGGRKVIMSDTVGFISDLPTQLVAAFRATLEEVLAADLILHVRDISHDSTDEQACDVETIMADLGVNEETPQLEIWNKIDLLNDDDRNARMLEAERREDVLAISAISGEGFDDLIEGIDQKLASPRRREILKLAFNEGRKRAWLFEKGIIEAEEACEDGWDVTVNWTQRQSAEYAAL
jgi:GTP-binding protein HflX